jgi:hypothetical protein
LVDEFRGAPNRVNSVLKEQGNPLRIGGSPIAAQTPQEPEKKKPAASEEKDEDKKSDAKGEDKKSDGKGDKKSDDKKGKK